MHFGMNFYEKGTKTKQNKTKQPTRKRLLLILTYLTGCCFFRLPVVDTSILFLDVKREKRETTKKRGEKRMSNNNDYRMDAIIVLDDTNDDNDDNVKQQQQVQVPSNTNIITSTIDEICIAQYEEKLLNYQKVFDTIKSSSSSSLQNDKENCSNDTMKTTTSTILAETIVAKSQLLSTIQNNYQITLNGTLPTKQQHNHHNNNNTVNHISIIKDKNDDDTNNNVTKADNELQTKRKLQATQALYDQTRKQLDIDTVTICNSDIYKNHMNTFMDDTIESICTDLSNSNLMMTCLNNNSTDSIQNNMTTDENDNDESDDDDDSTVDVDNFFDYHPHCIRNGWGQEIDDDDDEEDSDESDNNSKINNKDYNSRNSRKKKSTQQQDSTVNNQCNESSIDNNNSTLTKTKYNSDNLTIRNHNQLSQKVSGHSKHDPITIIEAAAAPNANVTTISANNQYYNDDHVQHTSDDQGNYRNKNTMNQNQGPVVLVNPYGRKNKDPNNNNTNNNSHNNISNDRNGINNDNMINCHQSYQSSMNNNDNTKNNNMHENNSNTINNQYGYSATTIGNTKLNNSSTSEWDDHYRRQNPFQTAREYSWASSDTSSNNNNLVNNNINNNNNYKSHDTNQHRNGNDNLRQQQYNHNLNQNDSSNTNNNNYNSIHRQASSENSQYNNYNLCQNDNSYNPYRSKQFEDKSGLPPAPSAIIRDSLKRKFQLPKVGVASSGKNTTDSNARTGNTSSGSSTNGDNKLPSKNRNSTNSTSSNKNDTNSKKVDDNNNNDTDDDLPECLKRYGKDLVEKIENEIMECGDKISFNDIAGLADQKQTVLEVVCWPMKRPDLFTGLRSAPNGLLLYGPPGTGKTLIGKAIAHESGATFFSISSSSLTSKWIGEGEKLVRTLFAVAAYREPAVVFIDEIDSLLTQRKADENEASRRIKTEFLCQLDGTGTSSQGRVLLIGATNRPQELDDAARRRFTKRLYIPLPERTDREMLLRVLLDKNRHQLDENEIKRLADDTEGYSGADIKALSTEAAMGPIRQLGSRALEVDVTDVPPIIYKHFRQALRSVRPSVSPSDLHQYIEWDKTYGSRRTDEDDDDEDDDDNLVVS